MRRSTNWLLEPTNEVLISLEINFVSQSDSLCVFGLLMKNWIRGNMKSCLIITNKLHRPWISKFQLCKKLLEPNRSIYRPRIKHTKSLPKYLRQGILPLRDSHTMGRFSYLNAKKILLTYPNFWFENENANESSTAQYQPHHLL